MSADKNTFIAGASGAIGAILCKLLVQDGWRVVGATRSHEKAAQLRSLGIEPVVLDVFDRETLIRAVVASEPRVVVHQLTDLPKQFSPENMAAARERNARIREIGTDNLVAAAQAAGAQRIVAQSIAFAYLPGPQPHTEEAPLDESLYSSVISLEQQVLSSALEGIVLRYGRLYGPNTWTAVPPPQSPVHVHAAADAARRAMTQGKPGIYNIAEKGSEVSSDKARRELSWKADFRYDPLIPRT